MGWVISQAKEWEGLFQLFWGRSRDFQELWPFQEFLAFYGWPQNCHGACGCVIQLMHYNELTMRLKVHWKSNLLPSWASQVLTGFCRILFFLMLCHSFNSCTLPPSFLSHCGLDPRLISWMKNLLLRQLWLCFHIVLPPPWRSDLNSQLPESFLEPHSCSLNSAHAGPQAVCFISFYPSTREASLEYVIMKSYEHLWILPISQLFL